MTSPKVASSSVKNRIEILEGRLKALSPLKAFFLLFIVGDAAVVMLNSFLQHLFRFLESTEAIRSATLCFHAAYLIFALIVFLRTYRDKTSKYLSILYAFTWLVSIAMVGFLTPVSFFVAVYIISPLLSLLHG